VTFLLQSTLAFDASIYLFWVLATGGCLVLPEDEQVSDPVALAGLMARHEVTDAFFVPGIYEAVLRVARPGSLSSCRRMYVGGDVVPPSVAALHHALLPDATFFNVYGPTEVVVTSTAFPVRPVDLAPGKPLPIGRPHPGTVAQVLDRHGRRVPVGAIGELHLGGPCVADGYDQEGAAQDDGPFDTRKDADGGLLRWYATGDLVRWRADGQLDYVGRRDRQVKLRGQRVELGEIETAARGVPGVEAAAVELLGTGAGRRLVLFVAPQVQGVRTALADVLPAASLPDVVVAWPELPRLPSGKLDRAVLRSQSVLPAPHVTAGGGRREQHGSETELERTVLSIVRTLLEDDRIGPDDDFFAVGGNSLLAARLVGQMSSLLGVTVPLHELVGNSTSRGIATLADRDFSRGSAASREEARLIPVRESGELPPAVLVARDGATSLVLQHFLSRMDVRRPLWVLLRPMPPLGFRVPDLAADGVAIARMLEERFPDGPIHLVGHSASGMVAVETARALGERRGATVLLDAVPPSRWSSVPPLRAAVNLARLVVKRRRLRLAGIRPPVAGDLDVPSRTARSLRLYQDGLASARTRMRRVGFPLTVLASAVTREELGREDLGWDRWAADLRVVPVGGDHVSLLLQPEVVVTAREIEDTLSAWGQP
jgi:enterobactin synthetase component F